MLSSDTLQATPGCFNEADAARRGCVRVVILRDSAHAMNPSAEGADFELMVEQVRLMAAPM